MGPLTTNGHTTAVPLISNACGFPKLFQGSNHTCAVPTQCSAWRIQNVMCIRWVWLNEQMEDLKGWVRDVFSEKPMASPRAFPQSAEGNVNLPYKGPSLHLGQAEGDFMAPPGHSEHHQREAELSDSSCSYAHSFKQHSPRTAGS